MTMSFLVITGPSAPIFRNESAKKGKRDFSCIAGIMASPLCLYHTKKCAIREKEGFYMKNSKKLLSLYLVIVMTLSMANGFVSKAADTITVLLRIEQDQATLTKPVQVTMTADDIKSYGDLELATDTLTPLHVLAKYLLTERGATEETLEDYLLLFSGYLYGISLNGTIEEDYGSPSIDPDIQDAYWMYAVNDASPVNTSTGYGYGMNEYPVQDNDEIVFYGIWGGDFTNGINPFYSAFEKKEYRATEKEPTEVTLLGFDIYNDYDVKAGRPMSGAHITVTDADGKQLDQDFVTDENGKVSLLFETAGTYTLSAYRETADGSHYDISRPYATVTVKEQATSTAAPVSANVVSYQTPIEKGEAVWSRSFLTTGTTSYNSIPVLTDDAIYLVNSDTLYELNYKGEILRQMTLKAKMNSVCNMLLEGDHLYIPLDGGMIEDVNIRSMTSVWQSECFGGQSLSTVFYHEGYLYAGSTTVTNRGTTGIFYCLSAGDGSTIWTYKDEEHPGGYYWSGGIVHGDALYFSGDNGILVAHSLLTDEVYDICSLTVSGKIRAGITYDQTTDAMYTTSTDGILYRIRTESDQIKEVKTAAIAENAKNINCTSTPTIHQGRIYVGCIADQTGGVSVLDAEKMSVIYHVSGFPNAEIKSTPLVSTRGRTDGTVYIYVSANALPGGIYCFEDSPATTTGTWKTLFTPASASQYCMASITAGSDGTLYYSNDSGTFFAVRESALDAEEQNHTQVPASPTPNTPAPVNPTPEPATDLPAQGTTVKKPKKPGNVRMKKAKRKVRITWKKKTKDSQTVIYIKYGTHKWQKKVVKKKNSITIKRKKGNIRLRLRSRKKIKGIWYFSKYTKTFLLK